MGKRLLCLMAWALPVMAQPAVSAITQPAGFTIAPYLIETTRTGTTVAFECAEPVKAAVTVFMEDGPKVFPSPRQARRHFIRITGLSPGRAFRYSVTADKDRITTPPDDPSYLIKTACLPGESFSFCVWGDTRPGETETHRFHQKILNRAATRFPAFSVILGDLVDDGRRAENWRDFFAIEAPLLKSAAIFPVVGDNDHADGQGRMADYFPALKRGHYDFAWGEARFFVLNGWGTLDRQPAVDFNAQSEQAAWLAERLATPDAQNAAFRIVFSHDPFFFSMGGTARAYRDAMVPIFERCNVDLVFASRHLYERSVHNGIHYVLSGGGGAELFRQSGSPGFHAQATARRHHFCHISLFAGTLVLKAIGADGTVLDSLTLKSRKSAAGAPAALQDTADRLRHIIRIPRTQQDQSRPVLTCTLFSYDCAFCRRLLSRILPALADRHGIAFKINYFDFKHREAYNLFLAAGARAGRQNVSIPALFVGDAVLGGAGEIPAALPGIITRFQENPSQFPETVDGLYGTPINVAAARQNAFQSLTLGMVLLAGGLDGINPCAFTTIIFLLAYLNLMAFSRRQILVTGISFTAAVFTAYFLMGLLFYRIARALLARQAWAIAVHAVLLAGLVLLALLSLLDAFRAFKGKTTGMTLQMPKPVKEAVRAKIRRFARNGYALTGASLILGAVIAGMELTCTGQVYLPMVAMISEPAHRAQAVGYLLAYNAAFILPLLLVFLAVFWGIGSQKLGRFYGRHLAAVKLGMAGLFTGMALLMLYNMNLI